MKNRLDTAKNRIRIQIRARAGEFRAALRRIDQSAIQLGRRFRGLARAYQMTRADPSGYVAKNGPGGRRKRRARRRLS